MTTTKRVSARTKILDATLALVRQQGFAATSVDELCKAAGVTKGAFFHHFDSKEALGVAAADYWSETTGEVFAAAPYHAIEDPVERILGYVSLRKALLDGETAEYTCLVGTMVQEAFSSNPAIRDACKTSIFGHAETLEQDIQQAIDTHHLKPDWTARSLALHTQAVLQGAFILAKASGDRSVAAEMVDHLARYIRSLFPKHKQET
ncbi:MAG: TetR/AcrR family transcriptional regulator [Pseudomonadota bacterium]|nr:TetR/AcrR family transcriptional regulator [Pseudomonadota bacterium]